MSQAAPGHEGHDALDGDDEEDGQGDGQPQITWVGQQWQMDGYCGRATAAGESQPPPPPVTPVPPPPQQESSPGPHLARPIAVVRTRRSQGRVVRIGPPREQTIAPAA